MITASIVTYKTDVTELEIILECVIQSPIEKIYIIDNSPADELRRFGHSSPKIEYRFGYGNIGYGAAHNIAISEAIESGAIYHIVLNSDIYFEAGTIEALSEYMDNNENVGQMMPRIVYPDGELQYLCKLLPTPMDLIGRRFLPLKNYVAKRNHIFELRGTDYNKPMNIPFLSGCFMFLRIAVLKEIGLFDTRFFMYCEDTDITRRIHRKYKTLFYPEVTIVHNHNKESYRSYRLLWIHIRSAIRYFNKWGWFLDAEKKMINTKLLEELRHNE